MSEQICSQTFLNSSQVLISPAIAELRARYDEYSRSPTPAFIYKKSSFENLNLTAGHVKTSSTEMDVYVNKLHHIPALTALQINSGTRQLLVSPLHLTGSFVRQSRKAILRSLTSFPDYCATSSDITSVEGG